VFETFFQTREVGDAHARRQGEIVARVALAPPASTTIIIVTRRPGGAAPDALTKSPD